MALRDVPTPMYVQTTGVSKRFKALKTLTQLVFYKTFGFNFIVFCPVRSLISCDGIDSSFFFFALYFSGLRKCPLLYWPRNWHFVPFFFFFFYLFAKSILFITYIYIYIYIL